MKSECSNFLFGFVIAFRAKENSKDWHREVRLLSRTLHSILNNKCGHFKIVVVFSDFPAVNISDDRIIWKKYESHFVKSDEISDFNDYASKYYDSRFAEISFDQGKKIMIGCSELKKLGCSYVMSVDADDLISCNLVDFVKEKNKLQLPGWVVSRGFIYNEGEKKIMKQPWKFNLLNGSSYIIRIDLIPIPFHDSMSLLDNNFFASHAWLYFRLKESGHKLLKLPFYGSVYVAHGQNWSNISELNKLRGFKKTVKKVLFGRKIDPIIVKEFGLYNIDL